MLFWGVFFFFLQDQEMGFLVSELQGSRRRSDHVTFLHARALVKTGNELPGPLAADRHQGTVVSPVPFQT